MATQLSTFVLLYTCN